MSTFIDGPAGKLSITVLGDGEPVSVFGHGVTGSVVDLMQVAARTPGTRVLLEARGHGASEAPADPAAYGHHGMAEDLACAADRFGATRAFGISMSAGALMRLLAADPHRFERVAFMIPATIDAAASDAVKANFLTMAERLETLSLDAVADRFDEELAALYARRPQWREWSRERVQRMNADGVPATLRAFVDGPPPVADGAALRAVTAPALVIGHEGDDVHPAAVARRLASLLPCARLALWPEQLAMYDDLDAFAATIGEFLSG